MEIVKAVILYRNMTAFILWGSIIALFKFRLRSTSGELKGVKGSYRGFSAARGVKGHYFCFSLFEESGLFSRG